MQRDEQTQGIFSSFKNLFASRKHEELDVLEVELTQAFVSYNKPNIEASTDKPMATRTVDFSHTEFVPVPDPQDKIVIAESACSDLENALSAATDLDIQFAMNLIEKGGKFMYCESIEGAVEELKRQAAENHWSHVFCWENEIKDAFHDHNFQRGVIGYTIENSDAAMCLCEALVAEDGNIILNPKQASRRRLPVFPKTQIFLADVSQLRGNLNKAILQFTCANKGELPSVLDLTDNTKGHYYHDGSLVLKAEGPADVLVFLVDEKIPVSLKA